MFGVVTPGLSAALKRTNPTAYWAEYDAAEGEHRDRWFYGRHGCEWHVREALPCEYRGVLNRRGGTLPADWPSNPHAVVAIRYRDGRLERWFGPLSSYKLLFGEERMRTLCRYTEEGWWRYLEAMHEQGNGMVLWDILAAPEALQ